MRWQWDPQQCGLRIATHVLMPEYAHRLTERVRELFRPDEWSNLCR
jgi:hypothetical protein